MEPTNIKHIPIGSRPVIAPVPAVKATRPANDIHGGPIKLHIPKDVLDDHAKRHAAGLATECIALPAANEAINVVIGPNCGQRADLLGTIKPARCITAIDARRILVKFTYGEGDPGTSAAWVTLSQLTFPNRNADCEVV